MYGRLPAAVEPTDIVMRPTYLHILLFLLLCVWRFDFYNIVIVRQQKIIERERNLLGVQIWICVTRFFDGRRYKFIMLYM